MASTQQMIEDAVGESADAHRVYLEQKLSNTFNPSQVNVEILNVDQDAATFVRVKPIWIKKSVAVVLKDENGNIRRNKAGEILYEHEDTEIIDKFVKIRTNLPVKFITGDLPKSNLDHDDIAHILEEAAVGYELIENELLEPGSDYSSTLLDIHGYIQMIVNLSRGLGAHGTRWAKTDATFTGDIGQAIQEREFYNNLLRSPNLDNKTKEQLRKESQGAGRAQAMEEFLVDVGSRSRVAQSKEFDQIGRASQRL